METSSQARPFARPDLRAGLFGLDPRTHLLAVVAFGVASIVLTGLLETALLQVAAALYLAGNGRARLALRSCASFAVVAGLSFLPLPGLYGVLFVSLLHMVPPFTAGCAWFSLSPSAFMCALARWRVPQRVLVGVCMLFRFASVLSFEARSIVRGIRLRGVFPRAIDVALHPALAYECCYTPLVMRCLRLSAELAASAELRGIEADGVRTSVHHVGFEARDALAARPGFVSLRGRIRAGVGSGSGFCRARIGQPRGRRVAVGGSRPLPRAVRALGRRQVHRVAPGGRVGGHVLSRRSDGRRGGVRRRRAPARTAGAHRAPRRGDAGPAQPVLHGDGG